jgi:FlaA1/EpsC-like NDP-sugar epimerase
MGPDLLVLYGGLLLGYRIRLGEWMLPHTTDWGTASALVLGVHGLALAASGLYRQSPRLMHLPAFLRVGLWLVGAWGASILLTYAIAPANVPPRGVMAVLGLVALVGVLGLRALVRYLLEALSPSPRTKPPGRSAPTIRLNDLVPRPPAGIDRDSLRDTLSDRTVLVTGAGGSIGAELSRQLIALDPFRLALVDVSEHHLYRLETTLRTLPCDGDLEFCIADVRDATLMDDLFRRLQPDVVLHAAAYKHVPLMERHPAEAFRNNTMATVHLLHLCETYTVDRFVFVSTDKAVRPANVMGATKRLAEWYVRTANAPPHCTTVRFGNVFGSQGSVVPRFEKKLATGEPLPVTHPGMERYFMSPEEASGLILHTLLLDEHPAYIFQMGDPIRIQWLAEQLIDRWYPHADPEAMIEYVGRRPGEKLQEELVRDAETLHDTCHPSILGLSGPPPSSRAQMNAYLQRLQSASSPTRASREQLRKLLLNTQPDGREKAGAPSPTPSSIEHG